MERPSLPPAEWLCRRPGDLALRHWEDGTVVFDDSNGHLQCLSPVAGELMAMLMARGAVSATALAQDLLGETPTGDDVEMVENALGEFSSLHLIERLAV